MRPDLNGSRRQPCEDRRAAHSRIQGRPLVEGIEKKKKVRKAKVNEDEDGWKREREGREDKETVWEFFLEAAELRC